MNKEQIMMDAFYDELEKNAQVMAGLFKGLKWLGGATKALGTSGKLESFAVKGSEALAKKNFGSFIEAYNSEANISKANKVYNSVRHTAPADAGFIQSHVADAFKYVKDLGKGLDKEQTLSGTIKRFGSNFWQAEKQQFRNGKIKTVNFTDSKAKFFQGNKLLTNPEEFAKATHIKSGFGPKRTIVGKNFDEANKLTGLNIKKRMPIRGLNYMMTPTGMVASGVIGNTVFGGNPAEGAKSGLEDAWQWTPATKGIGLVNSTFDIAKSLFSKNNN